MAELLFRSDNAAAFVWSQDLHFLLRLLREHFSAQVYIFSNFVNGFRNMHHVMAESIIDGGVALTGGGAPLLSCPAYHFRLDQPVFDKPLTSASARLMQMVRTNSPILVF